MALACIQIHHIIIRMLSSVCCLYAWYCQLYRSDASVVVMDALMISLSKFQNSTLQDVLIYIGAARHVVTTSQVAHF